VASLRLPFYQAGRIIIETTIEVKGAALDPPRFCPPQHSSSFR
jgi:hypothetical protein